MEGRIKFVKMDKGYGFIVGNDKKDYFFHRSDCLQKDFDELKLGDSVTFDDEEGDRGLRATNITR